MDTLSTTPRVSWKALVELRDFLRNAALEAGGQEQDGLSPGDGGAADAKTEAASNASTESVPSTHRIAELAITRSDYQGASHAVVQSNDGTLDGTTSGGKQ